MRTNQGKAFQTPVREGTSFLSKVSENSRSTFHPCKANKTYLRTLHDPLMQFPNRCDAISYAWISHMQKPPHATAPLSWATSLYANTSKPSFLLSQ